MAEIDDLLKEIQGMQETLSKDIAGLDKKEPSQRSQSLNKCQNKLFFIQTRIGAYDLEILQLGRHYQVKHKEALGVLQAKGKELKAELDRRKAEKKDLAQRAALEEPRKLEEMNVQELIQTGDKYQEEAKKIAGRILQNIHSADQKADQINLELDKQGKQVQSAKEKAQDTQGELKRTQKYLRYFVKKFTSIKF